MCIYLCKISTVHIKELHHMNFIAMVNGDENILQCIKMSFKSLSFGQTDCAQEIKHGAQEINHRSRVQS